MIEHLISKFFIYESITPHKASSHHFKNMNINAQEVGNYWLFYFNIVWVGVEFCEMF